MTICASLRSKLVAYKAAAEGRTRYVKVAYRTDADDASGFVVAGISQGLYLPKTSRDPYATDPSKVWYARPQPGTGEWEKKLLFEDDGSRIRSASAAVLVPIEPKDGKKLAWLFVTGFLSEYDRCAGGAMVAGLPST